MSAKTERQLAIKQILLKHSVQSQDELLSILKKEGFEMTQATLSRDLKLLKVAKTPYGKDGYRYIIPEAVSKPANLQADFLADGFRDIQFSGNMAVIRTLPGYASSIAIIIDNANLWEIIGTIAGDDTILIIMREGITKVDLVNSLEISIPKLKEKLI